MEFTQNEMADIVARASSIYDRLDTSRFEYIDNPELSNERLLKWKTRIDSNGGQSFQKRLSWEGLCEESIKPALGSVQLIDINALPRWAITLNAGLRAFDGETLNTCQIWEKNRTIDKEYAFKDILFPFIVVARDLLHQSVGTHIHRLSTSAQLDLERTLLENLSRISGQAFLVEFSLMGMAISPLVRFGVSLNGEQDINYRKFVDNMYNGGIKSFFKKYPVLAQLLGTCIDFWLDTASEFVQRLAMDWKAIETTFSQTEKFHNVSSLNLKLSDPHRNNRIVIGVTFDSGTKIIYKPKRLELDRLYSQLLVWFMDQGFPLPFKLLKLIPRDDYGWVEYIEQKPCQSEAEAVRYYQRAGVMLCLWYVLMGTDCHHENLIAHGEYPMYIDLETLMCPLPNSIGVVSKKFVNSVMTIGMLPRWRVTADGRSYDFSALGYLNNDEIVKNIQWQHINTDHMCLRTLPIEKQPLTNAPYLDGIVLQPYEYLNEIEDGFRMMYQFLMEKRDELFKMTLLENMSRQAVRFIFRNTEMYGSLARLSIHPRYLGDGVEHQIRLDVLSKALLLSEEKNIVWSIIREEYTSLKQQDIPFFTAYPKQDAIQISSNLSIPGYFVEPSFNQVITRLNSLDKSDLKHQIMLIHTSFRARIAHKNDKRQVQDQVFQLALEDVEPATNQIMIQTAHEIAQMICDHAIITEDGSANWIGMRHYVEANRYQLEQLGNDLYDGRTGIALFLAATDKVTGETTYHDFVQDQTLRPLHELLHNPALHINKEKMAERAPIGGALGLGSLAYALTKISQLLDNDELLEDAIMAGLLITPDRITEDRRFDLLLGTGGALLSLLTVYEATGDHRMKDLAILCGEHLLHHRVESHTKHLAWATNVEGRLLTGFSHGAAGIAYALLRLYEVTSDERFFLAAKEGIAFETAVFSPENNNWPDWRRWNNPKYDTMRWCSGAPGIGLARLAGAHIYNTEEVQEDMLRAAKATREAEFHITDHPCCGNLGRAEILMELARWFNDDELLDEVYKHVSWILARKQFNGHFSVSPFFNDVFQPTFFQGLAGIGYALLRIAQPELLPLILAWK